MNFSSLLLIIIFSSCGKENENSQIHYSEKNDIHVIVDKDSAKFAKGETWEEFINNLDSTVKDSTRIEVIRNGK